MVEDRFCQDEVFRRKVLWQIAKVSHLLENNFGCAQDVEGVIDWDSKLHIVQSRPQV